MRLIIIALVLLAGCGRALSEGEIRLTADVMGPSLDTAPIHMSRNPFIGLSTSTYAVRPPVTCRERIAPTPTGPTFTARTAGVVLFNRVLTSNDWTAPDYLPNYPEAINVVAAMYFAHEMTHVWQWQNRAVTGYHPLRAAAEHSRSDDPYLFDPAGDIPFLQMGYEQQASLVEEYVCCRTIAPEGARTQRLWQKLSEVLEVTPPLQSSRPTRVTGIAAGADLNGICD
ncbi:hypothetical protein [Octadecabacter sp. R77987]|uniref:hypothetical protein n=1 Tax=Octadecabacter sp. R77987 TaxID=3093874 RepID=UPI0036729E0F